MDGTNNTSNFIAESEWGAAIMKMVAEIDAKKMVPMCNFLNVLEGHSEYCEHCQAEEPTVYFDPTTQSVRCAWCDKHTKLSTVLKKARNLPYDYMERMIPHDARKISMEQIGDDVWITAGGPLAEVAGHIKHSYPDRDKFKPTNSISNVLTSISADEYEEATVSQTLYRTKYGDTLIAMLKSKNFTTYINNDFIRHIGGIITPHITSCNMKPVITKMHDKIRGLIIPMRFNPED